MHAAVHRDMPGYQRPGSRDARTRIVRAEERAIGFLGYGLMAKARRWC